MTLFELKYRKFENKPLIYQIKNTFTFTMEKIFETLATSHVDMTATCYSNMISTIVKRNFDNTFHHNNDHNQRQYLHKRTGQQYQSITL